MVLDKNQSSPIAVVGIGLRLPGGCNDAASYWDFLVNKRDARKPIPPERFNIDGFHGSAGIGNLSMRDGYFLDEPIDRFDAAFFSMTQTEAERLDPQQRLLLEVVYEALENAGETKWRGKDIGVYAGSFGQDWLQMQGRDQQDGGPYDLTGQDDFVFANRVSYEFDLRGPSMTVKVGCSSGLVAMHLACEALQRGDCSAALVGASNLILSPERSTALDNLHVLSPDGSSKAFDASANGYARAEGVNAVYIKRLDDAIRDGNPVRAIVRGTAVNADGKTRGLFSPSSEAQTALIRRAYEKAGISELDETPFIECHGTGTASGDPLELAAVSSVFGRKGTYIGSVKPNVGHAEAAAGLSSLIKAVLAVERKIIPPNIKFETPNPKIPFSESGLIVPTEPTSWPSDRLQRISINSFGLGGANAHVIVDAANATSGTTGLSAPETNGFHGPQSNGLYASPLQDISPSKLNGTISPKSNGYHAAKSSPFSLPRSDDMHISQTNGINSSEANETLPAKSTYSKTTEQRLLVFSAHNKLSLEKMISNYQDLIETKSFRICDLAYTLSVRRNHWKVRSFCVSDGTTVQTISPIKHPQHKGLLFIFTGQGAQWPGMGRELLRDFSMFRRDIRTMDSWLAGSSHPPSWKIEELLQSCSDISSAEYAQPICTAIQLALVNLLRQWNVLPTGVVGHSSGEIAAAYAAGAFGMKEALLISYYRGVAAAELQRPGAMAAVGLGRQDLECLLVGNVTLACENSRSSVTISGDSDDVEATLDRVSQARPGVLARKLKVDRAYHSYHMQEVGKYYENLIASIKPRQGKLSIPFFSSVTGYSTYDAASLSSSYWRSNMESPVLFLSAVESALGVTDEFSTALEIGPHSTLAGPFRQTCKDMEQSVHYINSLNRGTDCTNTVLTAMGQLYCHGLVPRFTELNPPGVTLSNLPTFPWNHSASYWHESRISREYRTREFPEHELLGSRVIGGYDLEPSWRKLLDVKNVPWLNDHIIAGDVVFPAAGYVALVGEATRQLSKSLSFTIRHICIGTALILWNGTPAEYITKLTPHKPRMNLQSSWYDFTVSSYDGKKWTINCSGSVCAGPDSADLSQNMFSSDVETVRQVNRSDWYRVSKEAGLEWRSSFQALQNVKCGVGNSVVSAEICDGQLPKISAYTLHPIALDQLLQCCILGSIRGRLRNMKKLVLLIHIGEIQVGAQQGRADLQVCTESAPRSVDCLSAHGQIHTKDGSVMVQCKDVQFRTLDNTAMDTIAKPNNRLHKLQLLEWRPDVDLTDSKQLFCGTKDLTKCITLVEKLHILCSIETTRMLKNSSSSMHHMRRFQEWNEQFVATIQNQGSKIVQESDSFFKMTSEERQALIRSTLEEALATPGNDIALAITRIYYAISDIFSGNTEPLALLLANHLLARTYSFFNMFDEQFLGLLGHSKPSMRVLEIGAGTGGFTSKVLPALNKPGFGYMYSSYTYTDVSSGFFKAADKRFREYPNLEYVKLDVSQDPVAQGFQEHSYDLVIAANVLHATSNLHETLSNCRSLLRPGGRLLMLELCTEAKYVNYIMGVLPGWWLGESDGRPNEPYLPPAQWDPYLRKAGFAGVEASVLDQEQPYQLDAIIIAKAVEPKVPPRKQLNLLLSNPNTPNQSAQTIQSEFEAHGYEVSLCSLENIPSASTDIVSLLDIDGPAPFFQDLSETQFRNLMHLIEQSTEHKSKVLWLTGPAQISTQNPYQSMVLGLARRVRKDLGFVFATLELDTHEPNPSQWKSIVQVLQKLQARDNVASSSTDFEFAFVNGNVCIPRFITSDVDTLLRQNLETTEVVKRLFITKPGLPNRLQWGLESRGDLQDNEIEVQVRSASLNSWDLDLAMGITQSTQNLGLECAGLISRIGANENPTLQVGDRVLCWSPGSLATHVRVDTKYCVKLPDNLPFSEAVTLPTVHATMIRGLKELCSLEHGESVLIHSAAGADGIAAIQIARTLGAEIFVTAATDEEKVFLETEGHIPQSHIFSSKDDSFVTGVLQSTDARGVDVFVNTLSGGLFFESWRCVAEGGSMIDLSKWDSNCHEKLDRGLLGGNRSFHSMEMVTLLQTNPRMAQRLLQEVLNLYQDGSIKPISPIVKFNPGEVKEAFQHLHDGPRIGAACIEFPEDSITLTADFYAKEVRFRPDHAYILVGDLRGLERTAALWLAERGAGSLIFLSSSASADVAANPSLILELAALGCSAQILDGSVADISTVKNMVANALKPIAGVLHLSNSVNDQSLLQMSHTDWIATASSKVQEAWNLHHVLQNQSLDFFTLMHSNQGQASYATANTFLDAFVQYRQQRNLPASIIDLGVMQDTGYTAETNFLESLELAIQSSNLPAEKAPTITSSFINRSQFTISGSNPSLDARDQSLTKTHKRTKSDFTPTTETTLPPTSTGPPTLEIFVSSLRQNPQSLSNDVEKVEAFLSAQILEAVKSLLIFDNNDEAALNTSQTMSDLAIDSLIAIELQDWWRESMGTQVSVLELTQRGSAVELGRLARERILEELGG